MLLHVSVLRPFLGSYIFLAKVTLELVILTQRSTECTSVAGHSLQHNITQHGMLPQHPTGTMKLICD